MNLSYRIFAIPPHTRFRGHVHEDVHICAVLAGGFVEKCGKEWVQAPAGTVRVSAAARHDIDFAASGARCLVLQPAARDLPVPGALRFFANDPWLSRLVHRLGQALAGTIGRERDGSIGRSPLELEDLATEFLAQVARRLDGRCAPPPPWLERVRDRVHDAPAPLCVKDVAAEVGVHRVHLARVFREHYGTSVTETMRRVRLERALRLLAVSRLSLAGVAAASGFADQSHLTRAVRAVLGTTPGEFRRATLPPFKTGLPGTS